MLALLTAACNNNTALDGCDDNTIRVNAQMPTSTRATLTNFEVDDQISLYAVEYINGTAAELQTAGNYLNNEKVTFDGAEWMTERTLLWSSNPCDFYAFYPWQPTTPMSNVRFDVAADQSTATADGVLGGYEASDLMWAKAENVSQADGVVNLEFEHMMSRVVVDIVRGPSYEGELPQNIDVHIYTTATSAFIDWRVGSLQKYALGDHKTIKMRKLDGDTFDAIVVPQFIERSTPLIEITMEGIAYLMESSISLRPGMQHNFVVTLNTSPDQEKIEISIDGEVGGWE